MGTTLAIVERALRGTVEQQYAHVLWLVSGLHRQSPMIVLLRGAATVYALDAPTPAPTVLGSVPWGVSADYCEALERLHAGGAAVLVSATSLDQLGLADRPMLPCVDIVTDDQIATVAVGCDRIWFL